MSCGYVVWQSRRKQDRQTQGLVADQDYPDRLTPIVTLAYHTGLDAGDIFHLRCDQISVD